MLKRIRSSRRRLTKRTEMTYMYIMHVHPNDTVFIKARKRSAHRSDHNSTESHKSRPYAGRKPGNGDYYGICRA